MRNTLPTQQQIAAAAWKLANLNSHSSMANQPSLGKAAVGTMVEHRGLFLKTQT